jgi:hypothetical protein
MNARTTEEVATETYEGKDPQECPVPEHPTDGQRHFQDTPRPCVFDSGGFETFDNGAGI